MLDPLPLPDLLAPGHPLYTRLSAAFQLGLAAGRHLHRVALEGFEVEHKADGSPVTRADREAEALIAEGLRRAFPEDRLIGEESGHSGPADAARLWLVDPLDGTADFARRGPDYCAMIGLCVEGRPQLGVLVAPALDLAWLGVVGVGARQITLSTGHSEPVRAQSPDLAALRASGQPVRLISSRSHPPPHLQARAEALLGQPVRLSPRGSVGVKVGLVLAGQADFYLHPQAGTSLWDCAGPEAVFEAAGGRFTRPDGRPIDYSAAVSHPQGAPEGGAARDFSNPEGILASAPALWSALRVAPSNSPPRA